MGLRTLSLPAHNRHTHTVIFLHGRWFSAHGLSEQIWDSHDHRGQSLQHIFPSVKWVFPQAREVHIERLQQTAQQWFDIWDARKPDERRELQIPGLKNTVPELTALIQSEAAYVGLDNVILAGTSQGCAAAIHALLDFPHSGEVEEGRRLCAFIGFSGWMSLGDGSVRESRELLGLAGPRVSDEVYRNTPVFIGHSADDMVVPIEEGQRLRDTLVTYGMDVTWKEYQNGGHWINVPQGIEDVVAFLRSQGLESTQLTGTP
ncbi:phospholipase/carboxylesterase family protein [Nemania abortiva]|nr:phospholipase/carboxylesterase family protein [Nemania abortiva]